MCPIACANARRFGSLREHRIEAMHKLLLWLDIDLLNVCTSALLTGVFALEGYRVWQSTNSVILGLLVGSCGVVISLVLSGRVSLFIRRFWAPSIS